MFATRAALLGLVLASTMPLPPELKKDVVVVKTATFQGNLLGKPRPAPLKGYAFRDFRTGVSSGAAEGARIAHGPTAFAFDWVQLQDGFSFRLGTEGEPPADLGTVACQWGYAKWSGDLSRGQTGVGVDIPGATSLACQIALANEEEPWDFLLWVDRPTNIVIPEFPSGGALVRGDVRYEVASTNAVAALGGFPSTRMTGTLFRRETDPVAAVERMPGRIIMRSSLGAAERSLFICVGAAILTYDRFVLAASYRH
jgi:hypothetical protein